MFNKRMNFSYLVFLLFTACGERSPATSFADRETQTLLTEINTIAPLNASEELEVYRLIHGRMEDIYLENVQ